MDFDILNETITPLNTTLLTLSGTGAVGLPSGTTAQRPGTAAAGAMRWNTSTPGLEYFNGTTWVGGSVSSIDVSGGTTGLTTSGGPITSSGVITLSGTLNLASGGTNASLTAVNGAVVYSTGTAFALTAAGTSGQILASTGAGAPVWTTMTGASYAVVVTPATLVSGNIYSTVITHNLGTNNINVNVWDNSTKQLVVPNSIQQTSTNAFTMSVIGNTRSYLVVVEAGGAYISNPSTAALIVQNNGVTVPGGPYTTLNFVGSTLTTTGAGVVATITDAVQAIRTLSYVATSLDSPNNSDWAVNALAPTVADPTNAAINVRQFSNTVEQGVGLLLTIPSTATSITFTYKGRPQTAPGATANIQMNLYYRSIPNNAALGSWSAAKTFTAAGVPTNAFTQYYLYTATLATLGLTAGNEYQFELTRNTTVSSNLASNWLMSMLDISFT